MQTTRRSADDNKVLPIRPGKGGRRCGYLKQRNEDIDSPTPRIEAGVAERGTKTKPAEGDMNINRKEGRRNQNQCWREMQELKMKAEEIPKQM